MIRALLALSVISLTISTAAAAKENCYSCHGKKGMKTYVDKTAFEASVHGWMDCTKCHTGIVRYPHGSVKKVNCGICHFLGREGAPRQQAQQFRLSVHGQAVAAGNAGAPGCQTCHGSHAILPSADPRSSTYRQKIPALCSQCHPKPYEAYSRSVHGIQFLEKKNEAAATCFDCHLEHSVPKITESRWKLSLIKECGTCHPEQMNTYWRTYHGKVTRLGYTTIAKCSDCHGSHDILPPADPASKLSSGNILATCGQCHPGATPGFTRYYAHAEETNRYRYPVLYYTYVFMTALLISVFAFFLTHTVLWAYRALKERIDQKGGR